MEALARSTTEQAVQMSMDFDIMQASVSDFENRRGKILPFVSQPQLSESVRQPVAPRRHRRFVLKGGLRRGTGRRMLVTGKIMWAGE